VLVFFFFFTTRYWAAIKRVAGPVLLPLGQHALYAYAALVAIIGPFALVVPPLDPAIRNGPWLTTVLKILAVGLVVLLVRLRFLMPTRATRRLWFAAPVVAGLLVFGLLFETGSGCECLARKSARGLCQHRSDGGGRSASGDRGMVEWGGLRGGLRHS
jgi:hypothetical protein